MTKLLRVGIYLRLSDEDRNKLNKSDNSESIKNQRNLLMTEIEKNDNFFLVDEYCDEDLSGAGTFRPEFERLIRDCEKGKIDVVMCKSQSRFSRDMEIIEKYLHNKFIEWNIRFIGLADNADTSNLGNKKARQINGLVNEWYLEDVSNNIRSAFDAKMKQGEFISPFAPFGYEISKTNNNKLTIDQNASLIVREIFTLYLNGFGFAAIAKYLNKKNVPSPSLYKYQRGIKLNIISSKPREQIKWSPTAIKTILTNEVYLGHLIQGKRTTISYKNHKIKKKDNSEWIRFENTHEAIIEQEIFDKVRCAIKQRTRPMKKNCMIHKFSGKVFCLECGCYMRKKNSSKYEYLVCSNNGDDYDVCINKHSIRYDVLENIILNEINKKIEIYYDDTSLSDIEFEKCKKFFIDKIKLLEIQKLDIEDKISEFRKYLKNLYEDKVNKIISVEQFKQLSDIYNGNERAYNNRLKSINKDIDFYKIKLFQKDNYLFNKYKSFGQLNKVIVDEFIKKVYIGNQCKETNTRNIQIEWNF